MKTALIAMVVAVVLVLMLLSVGVSGALLGERWSADTKTSSTELALDDTNECKAIEFFWKKESMTLTLGDHFEDKLTSDESTVRVKVLQVQLLVQANGRPKYRAVTLEKVGEPSSRAEIFFVFDEYQRPDRSLHSFALGNQLWRLPVAGEEYLLFYNTKDRHFRLQGLPTTQTN